MTLADNPHAPRRAGPPAPLPAGRPYLLWHTVPHDRRVAGGGICEAVVYVDGREVARIPYTLPQLLSATATIAHRCAAELTLSPPENPPSGD